MNIVKSDVENLVLKEQKAANMRFPPFYSPHEGYAVILERFETLKDDINKIEQYMAVLWNSVKQNEAHSDIAKVFIGNIKIRAIFAATEAIRLAAMCERFKISFGLDKASKQSVEDPDTLTHWLFTFIENHNIPPQK